MVGFPFNCWRKQKKPRSPPPSRPQLRRRPKPRRAKHRRSAPAWGQKMVVLCGFMWFKVV